jgi:hypothetical protein
LLCHMADCLVTTKPNYFPSGGETFCLVKVE